MMMHPLKSVCTATLCCALVVLATSASLAEQHSTTEETETVMVPVGNSAFDRVVAKVGETPITIGHMIAMTASLPAKQREVPPNELFQRLLERLIQQESVAQTVTNPSQMVMRQMENERRSLLASSAIEKLAARIEASEEAIKAAYDLRYADFTPGTEFKAAHILVKTEAEAIAIAEELAGGADFATLARSKSTGPSGPNGGNLGWFGPGRMVAPFEEAVKLLDIGGVSPPVETQFGWHVIMLNESRIPSVPSLEDIRSELEQQVWRASFEEAVGSLLRAASVDRMELDGIDPMILLTPMDQPK